MTRTTTLRAAAVFSGFIIAILMVMTSSRALFTDPTSNDANAVSSGSVSLDNGADNDNDPGIGDGTGDAMFGLASGTFTVDASNMVPGDSVTNCIEIIYGGNVSADIELTSVTVGTDTSGMASVLDLDITRYDDDAADCGGTSEGSTYSGTLAAWADAETAWTASSAESKWYEFTLALQAGAGNTYQGQTTSGIDFEWTATNN